MVARVNMKRTVARQADVVTGRAVRARTWLTAGELLNWSGGQGECLVPAYDPGQSIAAGASKPFVYRIKPPGRAVRRVWSIVIYGTGRATITAGASAAVTYDVTAAGRFIEHNEDLTAKSAAEASLTLTIAMSASASTSTVASIACHESPRATLALDSTDYGVDLITLQAREPIDARLNASLGGIFDALVSQNQVRHYLNYARPADTADAWSTTSAVAAPLLSDVLVLGRRLTAADSFVNARFGFYCRASDATTDGEIAMVSAAAGTTTLTVTNPGTSWAWYTIDASNQLAAEDLTQSSGLPGASYVNAEFDLTFRRSGGVGTFYVASCAAFEI